MAAELVDVVNAIVADLESDYAADYAISRAWHVPTLWKEFGTETEEKSKRIRIFVVPVAAPRSELVRGIERVDPAVSIAVCRATSDLCEQDELVGLVVEILKDKRRKSYTTDSGTANVTTAEHIPMLATLLEQGVAASVINLTLRMEVAHG